MKTAISAGYALVTLEEFLDGRVDVEAQPTLILRHDVDQHPTSALRMSDVEVALGVRSTWYFRWRTANTQVIAELRRRGGELGFHYETLSREARAAGESEAPADLSPARERLREEIAIFLELHGPIRSVSAHGDTRVPGIRNGDLLRDEDWREYGIDYDANDAMRRHRLAAWLTDRSAADGAWSNGQSPEALFREGETPILCLTHPNNWVSGPSLWRDRIVAELARRTRDAPPPR
ncbi:MAG: hypothetical protein WDZ46_04255 [Solirubrobacterales bacterium]